MVISLNHHHHRHDWRMAFTEHHAALQAGSRRNENFIASVKLDILSFVQLIMDQLKHDFPQE